MEVVLEMTLPRDAESAPLVRHTLDASLRGLGVTSDIRADISLALGEACANAIQHAVAGEYEVRARMDGARCVVEVIDGGGTGPASWEKPRAPQDARQASWDARQAPPHAESGRGLQLIRAFMEEVHIMDRVSRNGAIVHFEKSLAS
ncbi:MULTISPECIES: ATP-binding protein [Actinomadura]|uniref:ATP-binding protein n=1 Tax=Actinomadura litoris TaxID=2678616 RepID=A0A7K1L1P5_9ACTN|nr:MULTISPECIES: ATP-binding protein [Actinomadura]MBT2206677.1 ATP-binding protein [Actinomadura sp. NEAU-AAG7]MUN38223.1 ATP-binding protein [Actinomadura litoris]